jgi:putative redox protein
MIRAQSESKPYQTRFTDGVHEAMADTTVEHGGNHDGFRPHDLLEAALATCTNMTVRIYAERHGIPLRSVATKVVLDRSKPEEPVFRYKIALDGDFTPEQKAKLLLAAGACPVRKTLSKPILFEHHAENAAPEEDPF